VNKIIMSFLKEANSILEPFFIFRDKWFFSPPSFVIFSFFMTVYSSFIDSLRILILLLIFSVFMTFLLADSKLRIIKMGLIPSIFSLLIALPKIIIYGFSDEIKLFLLRVLVSSLFIILCIGYLGIYGFLSGLNRLGVPRKFLFAVYMFLHNITIMINEAFKILVARLSREVKSDIKSIWNSLAFTTAAIMERSRYKAKMQYLALRSRGGLVIPDSEFSKFDVILYMVIALCVVLMLL